MRGDPWTCSTVAMVRPSVGNLPGTIPGPDAVAAAIITTEALQRADLGRETVDQIVKALGDVLPGHPLQAGAAAVDRRLPPDALTRLVPSAAVVAAGLDPARTSTAPPPGLWQDGANRLLVRVAGVRAQLGDGTIVLTVPVTCDQTGDADVTVTFVTGTPDRPAGGIVTTEDHPRGPAPVVENWAEPIVAFAWQTLVTAASAVSGAAGGDLAGHDLITAGLAVNADGFTVTPMGRYAFTARNAVG